MNGNGPLDPVATTERLIRKSQRAIGITLKIDYSIGMGGETAKRALIMEHTEKIIELKTRLLALTGRCSPSIPKWPL